MLAEIYTNENDANARQLEWYNLKKDLPKYIGNKYSIVFQHPNENRWAVPCTNDGLLAVENNGVILSPDWFPDEFPPDTE